MRHPNDFGALPPPPAASSPFEERRRREELRTRRTMLIAAGAANAVGGIIIRVNAATISPGAALLIALVVGALIAVAAYRLARRLYGVGAAILAAVLSLLPLVYIGVVVFLCIQASKRLSVPQPPSLVAPYGG
jgi:fatty acid desaturase